MIKKNICFLFLFFFIKCMYGKDNFHTKIWNNQNGLPQNSIKAIVQDKDSFIWLGTEEGLLRFNGIDFKVFNKDNTPMFKNNTISHLLVDNQGTLWVFLYKGDIVKYKEKFIPYKNNIIGNKLINHVILNKDNILIGSDNGIFTIKNNNMERLKINNKILQNNILNILSFKSQKDNFISLSSYNGIQVFLEGKKILPLKGLDIKDETVWCQKYNKKELWLGTHTKGVVKGEIINNKIIFSNSNLKNGFVRCLYKDKENNIWAGLAGKGIFIKENSKDNFRQINISNKKGLINKIFQDKEENFWLGFNSTGLMQLIKTPFKQYNNRCGLKFENIYSVLIENNDIYMACKEGIAIIKNNKTNNYLIKNKKEENIFALCLFKEKEGLYIGTSQGVWILKDNVFQQFNKVPKYIIYSILIDSKKRIWVGTKNNGLFIVDNKKVIHYTKKNGLSDNRISVIKEALDKKIYVGSDNGLNIFESLNSNKILLSNTIINDIYFLDKNIWIGTNNKGVIILGNDKVKCVINSKNGLYDNRIYSIIKDSFNKVWFTSNKGLFNVSLKSIDKICKQNKVKISCDIYTTEDGLNSNEFSGGVSPSVAQKGVFLYYPTKKGLLRVDTSSIKKNLNTSFFKLKELYINNNKIKIKEKMILPPYTKTIKLNIILNSFIKPQKAKIAVKLEKIKNPQKIYPWEIIKNRPPIFKEYTNLKHGNYVLKIKSINSDGIESQTKIYKIKIKPYFYNLLWGKIIFSTLIIFMIFFISHLIYRVRLKRLLRQKKELQQAVKMRTKELEERNIQLKNFNQQLDKSNYKLKELSMEQKRLNETLIKKNRIIKEMMSLAAHDLKNPLQNIIIATDMIQGDFLQESTKKKYLKKVEESADIMRELIEDILEKKELREDEFTINRENIDIKTLLTKLINIYNNNIKEENRIILNSTEEECSYCGDYVLIKQAFNNLINNALKFSQEEVNIKIERNKDEIKVEIKDKGEGFSKEDKLKIFQKFTKLSTKAKNGEKSTGLGLYLTKRIFDLHNICITLKDNNPQGAIFIITFKNE